MIYSIKLKYNAFLFGVKFPVIYISIRYIVMDTYLLIIDYT